MPELHKCLNCTNARTALRLLPTPTTTHSKLYVSLTSILDLRAPVTISFLRYVSFLILGLMAIAATTCGAAPAATDESRDRYAQVGDRVSARMEDGVAITEGVIRVRRRHENDMDFSKYNPFYWEGRLTQFRIEDYTPRGENKIKFTLLTEWPQDYVVHRGPDFSCIYIGDPLAHETLRSKFALNFRMKHVANFKHFEQVVDEGAFRAFPKQLMPGKVLTLEYRFFNNEAHAPWKTQKERNQHNLSAYYSEFFRIRVGSPGIHIDNLQQHDALPHPDRYSGGWTTIPTVRVEPWKALQQQAFNLTPKNSQAFLLGRTWFHTDFNSGKHVGDRSDDKPSVFFKEMEDLRSGYSASLYNVTACNACHIRNGSAPLPNDSQTPIHTTVVKTMDPKSGNPHSRFGGQLQTSGGDREGTLFIKKFTKRDVRLSDGTIISLSKPEFTIEDSEVDSTVALSPRRTPALIGMGLLDAVPDKQIRELARSSKGEVSELSGDRLGRFGWKASQPTVRAQIRDALLNDMGILSKGKSRIDAPGGAKEGRGALPEKAIDELETYVALLGVPPRNNPTDPQVVAGEKLFQSVKCQSCHVSTLRTGRSKFPELQNQTIHPYTDLVLHDMGPGLKDEAPNRHAQFWRTAPLWGLKNALHASDDFLVAFRAADTNVNYEQTQAAAKKIQPQLLHDGRAKSLAEAILWHGGEATESVELYKKLTESQRSELEDFLWDL
jgi:CxxC motif-containing protein (DUF1111 family)